MKQMWKWAAICALACFLGMVGAAQADAAWQGFKVDDAFVKRMADFDPNNPIVPTGDVIKVGLMQPFSGPASVNGQIYWATCNFIAHDINKSGGLMVDGKLKKVVFVKGDTMGKPAATKKAAEKLILEDKVDVLWGTSGSHLALILQQVAKKYKVIYHNSLAMSDELMDKRFNKYTFQTFWTTHNVGWAFGKYFQNQKERKFYILCQDYLFGHSLAKAFKDALKKYVPDAKIVGEDYHPLFAKDFAPYLTKIKASGAEVIYTGDWIPDAANLLKQARQQGITLPFANIFLDEPNMLKAVGVKGTKDLIHANEFMTEEVTPFAKVWTDLWKTKWSEPYNTPLYKWPGGTIGATIESTYWLFDVIRRAKSTKPNNVIKVWEGDVFPSLVPGHTLKMRACDHRVIRDMFVSRFVYPNKWYETSAHNGKVTVIPAEFHTNPKPKRCK